MHNRSRQNLEHTAVICNAIHGDMPGDKIEINLQHIHKAEVIYPILKSMIRSKKAVICVCGGSGVGKSEIASVLAGMLLKDGIGAYIMSGDNYPHRIPMENDALREQVFRNGGREELDDYLGSPREIDFDLVNQILTQFKGGAKTISMKRMGRTRDALWFEDVDMSNVQILILEWTHGNSDFIQGVDIPILLNSTPEETLEHRRKRNRDGGVDSPFTTMVLELEQQQLVQQAHKAKIIVAKSGNLMTYEEFCDLMGVAK